MKSKINSPDESCFNLPSGYSIDMSVSTSIPFAAPIFLFLGSNNNWGSLNYWWNNLQSGLLITLTNSFYNQISFKSTASTKYQTWCTYSPYL
jgi:hypothetical protein